MRLYLNKKESETIDEALKLMYQIAAPETRDTIQRVLDRIELCDLLQQSEKKSRTDEP